MQNLSLAAMLLFSCQWTSTNLATHQLYGMQCNTGSFPGFVLLWWPDRG